MSAVRYLTWIRTVPPIFTLREMIVMADVANDLEDLAEKVETELPVLLRRVKACA